MTTSVSNLSDVVFDIGDYVEITQNRRGTIKYEGNIKFVGYIIGIELDNPISGGTDGTLLGLRYFKCRKKHATFVKISKIKSIIKPRSTQNRMRKALHLPITDTNNAHRTKHDTNNSHSLKRKKRQKKKKLKKRAKTEKKPQNKKKTHSKSQNINKKKKVKRVIPSLSTDNSDSSHSSNDSKDTNDIISLSKVSKHRNKHKRKRSDTSLPRMSHTTSSPAIPPPRTPRPRLSQRKRATSSLKLDKHKREQFLLQNKSEKLAQNLKILSALKGTPLRKRQNALKECINILSNKQSKSNAKNAFFDNGSDALDSMALKYFIDGFKKAFWRQIQDRKTQIQRDTLSLLHCLIKYHWLFVKKYTVFYVRKILLFFEKNDIKTSYKWIEPIMKALIKLLSMSEDRLIIVRIICEFIQFATKSQRKIVKKNCWIYIGLYLEKHIAYRQKLPSASSSPSYAIGANKKKHYSFAQSHQNPQNLLDILQSGLKKGISDSDRATQSEAMRVLTMFSFLDETRAERLISRMSGTAARQYNIYKKQNRILNSQSPRASLLTSPKHGKSPKNNINMRSKSRNSSKIVSKKKAKKAKKKKSKKKKAAIVIEPSESHKETVKKPYVFTGMSLSTDMSDTYKVSEEIPFCTLSDDNMSSTDTEDTFSGDSNDSDDEIIKKKKTNKKPSFSIPSVSTNNDSGNEREVLVESDESDTDSDNDNDSDDSAHKKPFIPSLNTMMGKSGDIYDRNTNIKKAKTNGFKTPGLARPSSAKFGPNDKSENDGRNMRNSMRPSSARASDTKKIMSFTINASEDSYYESEDNDSKADTPTSIDSDCSDSDYLSSDSEGSDGELFNGVTQRDISVFRGNINNGYMPKETNITFDGLFNEYYFDTMAMKCTIGDEKEEKFMFYPRYSYGKVSICDFDFDRESEYESDEENDSDKYEHYLRIDLNSNANYENIQRKKLNICILLDQSGSMGSTFNNGNGNHKSKMSIANECLCHLIDGLNSDDRLALVSFDDEICIHTKSKLELISDMNLSKLKRNVSDIKENGGTNFELAYEKANQFFDALLDSNDAIYDNRIIMLTDACPNVSATDPHALVHLFRKNCERNIYTTFVAIGLDFNTEMVSEINIRKGCNYYSAKSAKDFEQILVSSFDAMVTPLMFNVCLTVTNNCIANVYGVNDKRGKHIKHSGEVQRIGTLFPEYEIKSEGMVFVKLKKKQISDINIEIRYEDRNGKIYENNTQICLNKHKSNTDYFDDIQIRKGILLCRYCRLLKQWIYEDIDSHHLRSFLNVSEKWKNIFSNFITYFKREMTVIKDSNLQKEIDLVQKLVSYRHINTQRMKSNASNTSTVSTSSMSSQDTQLNDVTDLIISFLELKDPRITWKMVEFLSNEPTTTIIMSFLSRLPMSIDMIDSAINSEYYQKPMTDETILHSTDSNEIRLTQLSYSLMSILSNDTYTETVKSFLQRKCESIALHAFAVFHPLSNGNAYHSRVILECLLQNCPKELFECIAKNKSLKQLLKCALFRNINRGNMNSFFLDLICYKSVSRQKLYRQQTQIHHSKLIKVLCEWDVIPYVIKHCHLDSSNNITNDNICGKFCQFFIDLTARSAALHECKALFNDAYAVLIVDELIGKGLLGNDSTTVWTQIQCTQTLIQFLDICSRPTIFDSNNKDNAQKDNTAEYPNIFYSLFEPLLNRLHSYIPQLSNAIMQKNVFLNPIQTTNGVIDKPFGQFRLNCFELLTVAADFAQFDCGKALAKIPILFFKSLLDLCFTHDANNFFLVHFRRLIHLAMIFRRRILKSLFLTQNMLIRFINYCNARSDKHTDLSAYIVQMLFDFYDHDRLAIENAKKPRQIKGASSVSSFEDSDSSDESEESEEELRANFSDEIEDQWSISEYFDSIELWQSFKVSVIEEIDAQTNVIAEVPNWDMGQSSKLDELISSLLRTENDSGNGIDQESDSENYEFRKRIVEEGLMPAQSSVSYFQILNEYFFDLSANQRFVHSLSSNNDSLMCYPSFSFAQNTINDTKKEYFMAIEVNVNESLFNNAQKRNKLNVVIVLDVSESMNCDWNGTAKIESALNGIQTLILDTLNKDDRIGLLTFDKNGCDIYQYLQIKSNNASDNCKKLIHKIRQKNEENNSEMDRNARAHTHPSVMKSGIDFESAFVASTNIFEKLFETIIDNNNKFDNRIIFVSDYIPFNGLSFLNLIKNCSEDINERICTSFLCIGGCEYNSVFISHLSRMRGCNYYCPHSPNEFMNLCNNECNSFDQIVTPLIYDLCLNLKHSKKEKRNILNCFTSVYGIKNERKQKLLIQSGEIYKNYTLFLSDSKKKKNGIILIPLNQAIIEKERLCTLKIEMSFEDRDGRWYEINESLQINTECKEEQYFDNIGTRKAVLLCKYISILKLRISDDHKIKDSNSIESEKWKIKLKKFIHYFETESKICNDELLLRELNVLKKLCDFS